MSMNSNKDRRVTDTASDRAPSLEALIKAIDHQVDQVPSLSTAEGFAAFLGGHAEDYQRRAKQYVRFVLDGNVFALPLQNALAIDYLPEVITLPNIPQWVLGICNLRGDIVSVVDIKQLFHLKQGGVDTDKKLILIHNKDIQTAIVVDNIAGMLAVNDHDSPDDIGSSADMPFSKFVKEVIISGRQTVYLLDPDILMTAIEV